MVPTPSLAGRVQPRHDRDHDVMLKVQRMFILRYLSTFEICSIRFGTWELPPNLTILVFFFRNPLVMEVHVF